jgi:KTSC domain
MADSFKPSKKYQSRAAERWNELSVGLSKLGPLNDFEVFTPLDAKTYKDAISVYTDQEPDQRETTPAYQTQTAPTSNPPKPRALKLAYSSSVQKLVIKFRDGTWWEYNGIDPQIWQELKASASTGKYLRSSGLDTHGDMGPFNPNEMPEETRVLFNS